MAIAFVAASGGGKFAFGAADPLTYTLDVGSASDRMLPIFVGDDGDASTFTASFNGVDAGTYIERKGNGDGLTLEIYAFLLANPASGSHTVSVTTTRTGRLVSTAPVYSGVTQTGQPEGTPTKGFASATSITLPETVVNANAWQVMGAVSMDGTAHTGGTDTTLRDTRTSNITIGCGDSNAGLSAGSHSLQLAGGNTNWFAINISLAEAAGAAAGQPTMRRFGVMPYMNDSVRIY